VRSLAEVLDPSTVELVYRYVVAIFRAAAADRVIPQNPAAGTRLPKAEQRRVEPLEAEVVQAIIETVPDRYRALVVLAAGTGLRQGECFELTLDRVDFLRRQLTVDRQLVLLPGSGPVLGAPKTQASYRVVPLPAVVLDALAAHLARYPVGHDGFLFTNHAGEPIRRTRFSALWRPAVKASGAPAGTGFHSMRHFYAPQLISHGESVKVVQADWAMPARQRRSTRTRIFGPTARTGRAPRSTKCSVLVCHLRVTPRSPAPKIPGQVGGGGEPAYRRGSVRRPASRYRRGGHPSKRPTWGHWAGSPSHVWPCSGWGLPSRPGHPDRWCALTAPFHPYLCTASRAIGGLFSVALSCGSPRLAVSQHPALWSPDLPQPAAAHAAPAAATRPARHHRSHSRT
jgi:hypothetical protein